MNVDESRGDDQASSIDHPDGPSSFGSSEPADSGDRILVDGDVGGESGSPGAIYPALRSLKKRGLIQPVREKTARHRTVYGLSQRGRRAFVNWLRSRVDWWALLQNPDMFMLRVSFIRECERPAAVRQFLKEVSQEATAGTVALAGC